MPPTDQEIRELQLGYISSTRDTLATLRGHSESLPRNGQFKSSFPVLLYLAHQLKGSGGTLGFAGISDAALELTNELETFLDDAVERPAPEELAARVTKVLDRLELAVTEAERQVSGEVASESA